MVLVTVSAISNAAFGVQVRIPAIHSHREYVGNLQVRLRAHRGKVEAPVGILKTQFVDQRTGENRRQVSDYRLIAETVVLESGRQVEPVVQRRKIGRALVVEEIAYEQRLPLAEGVVDPEQHIVVVDRPGDLKILSRQAEDVHFHVIDVGDVCQHGRVVERRLDVPLSLVVPEEKSLILLNRPAQGRAKLILAQFVEPGGQCVLRIHRVVAEVFVDRPVQRGWSRSW